MMAATESPGTPRVSMGMKAPAQIELLAASEAATPSIMPVPNFSGVFEARFSSL